ncbi:uncharacterized protein LOC134834213 [Culicoides brevitarsis]|uniref:uncharacterized protein LOC134834213 n=1 Tax=Culicoides brevitarsis TaxID=469753 RepID=UPI00307B1CD3
MTFVIKARARMSDLFNSGFSDLNTSFSSILDEARNLLGDFHPVPASRNTSRTNTSSEASSSSSSRNNGAQTNSTADDDGSDIEEIVQEIPVVDLLDATIDVGINSGPNPADDDDDDIIFVQESVATGPITIDLCSDSFVGPIASTPNNPRRRAHNEIGSILVPDMPEPPEIPRRRRRIEQIPSLAPPSVEVVDSASHPTLPQSPPKPQLNNSVLDESMVAAPKCPICLENCTKREPTATTCGHIFCKACIMQCIRVSKKCPMCKKPLNNKSVHRLFWN